MREKLHSDLFLGLVCRYPHVLWGVLPNVLRVWRGIRQSNAWHKISYISLTFINSILSPILKSFWKVRARLPFCNEAFPTVYEKVTRKVSGWFGLENGLMLDCSWQKVPHLSSWSGESRREKRRESGASCRREEKPCCLSHLQVDFLCHSLCIMNKVCIWKNVTYEHKNFIARNLLPMIIIIHTLHILWCISKSMKYFR